MSGGGSLSELLTTSTATTPEGIALRTGDDAWTFPELAEWSGRLAKGLVAAGTQPGDRIASFMPNCAELIAGYWACFAAGLVAVPLNHRCIAADAAQTIGNSGSAVLIAHSELAERLAPLDWKELGVEQRYFVGEGREGWAALDELRASEALEPVALDPDADALITRGTSSSCVGC
jgi:long-chain acyl-CoA synthetase